MFQWLIELLRNRHYNQELYRSGKANKDEVRLTSIGHRTNNNQIESDPKTSPSGGYEYYEVIRTKKK